ncbi:MAG TPA: hypothetical protein VIB08_01775, partial [Thermoanaerobaculia bacterium]
MISRTPVRKSAAGSLLALALFGTALPGAPSEAVPVPGGPASIRRLFGLTADRSNDDFFLDLHEMLLFGSPEDAGWASVVPRRRIVAFADDLGEWRATFGNPAVFSPSPPDAWSRCARALEWLGFDVRGSGAAFRTVRRPDATSVRRQTFLDALGVPTRDFLRDLGAGKTVTISVSDDAAPLPFGLDAWKQTLAEPDLTADGAFLYFVKSVPASRMLVALHAVDPPTREELRPAGDSARDSWRGLFEKSL